MAVGYADGIMPREMICGSGPQGLLACMAANRISFQFDFRGPSLIFDTACSASFAAYAYALQDLQAGRIDNAIVGGANFLLEPYISLVFVKYNMMAKDGKCKVFSNDRDGYVRSEAVVSMFLQRQEAARKIYLRTLGSKVSSDGFSSLGMGNPKADSQFQLIKNLYDDIGITPDEICYFETHGTGRLIT